MPSHKSAIKRVRQTEKRTARNRQVMSNLRTTIKGLLTLIDNKDKDNALKTLPSVISTLDKAATKGVIHKKQSSRRVSRLVQKVNDIEVQA